MAKTCVKCGKPIPFLEGKRHPDGMYCNQCDIEAFINKNCCSQEFMDQVKKDAAKLTAEKKVAEQQPSPVDEIKKYKALLDEGIISQEDFDAKKKQLLGL